MGTDIYVRRFIEQSRKQGVPADTTDTELAEMAMEWHDKQSNPKLAAMEQYPKKELRRKNSEDLFLPILRETCHAFGLEVSEANKCHETEDWRNIRAISCWIAINDCDIRPHTPIRDMRGMKNNGMVRHAEYRASRMIEESVMFAEKLISVREGLGMEPLTSSK